MGVAPKKIVRRDLYYVRLQLFTKPLKNMLRVHGFNPWNINYISEDREKWLNEAFGWIVSRNLSGTVKIGFPSREDYLFFVLKWA